VHEHHAALACSLRRQVVGHGVAEEGLAPAEHQRRGDHLVHPGLQQLPGAGRRRRDRRHARRAADELQRHHPGMQAQHEQQPGERPARLLPLPEPGRAREGHQAHRQHEGLQQSGEHGGEGAPG
jgi:hypothetical protein